MIIRARLKPLSGTTEYISSQGRIKSMLENNRDDNYDFVIEEKGKKSVKSFGIDNINKELVGKTISIVNDNVKAKFNEDGTVDIVLNESNSYNNLMSFKSFIKESLPRENSVKQLKKVRKKTKGIDIGDRINQKINNKNLLDSHIESFEDYESNNKKFNPNININK